MRLVLSTRNAHKVREFAGLLDGVDVAPLPDSVVLPPETGETFAENALVKARTAAAATVPLSGEAASLPCSCRRLQASASATNPPVIEAQRVPPSAVRTSQST